MARKLKGWRELTRKSVGGVHVETGMILNLNRWRCLLVAGAVSCLGASSMVAFEPDGAEALYDAHMSAFYKVRGDRGFFKESTDGGLVSYWMWAEQMEMVLDAYERNRDKKRLLEFRALFQGFLRVHGETWEKNDFNDDIMWMVIACTRAHLLTGKADYLKVAKANFDLCYQRAHSGDLGGGLWWKTENLTKNACVNGPGAIAAFLLGEATKEDAYKQKAKEMFGWVKANLFDPKTGAVADHMRRDKRVHRRVYSYNQGTFVGAADFLGFHDEARLAAGYTMKDVCRDGYFPPAGEQGDGGGFHGIAVRWIAKFIYDHGHEAEFEPWLRKNAKAAWEGRRKSDNLSWCRWPDPTPEGRRYSWGNSSAVVLLQVVKPLSKKENE
ncbi:glycoside hydrolase family 76 protein [Verrucomicrobiaceae bacterium 227]